MEHDWLSQYLDAWDEHLPGADGVAERMIEASTPDICYEDVNMMAANMKAFVGADGMRKLCEPRPEFPDARMNIQSRQVNADRTRWAIEWEMTGTRASTGTTFRVRGASTGTLAADGRVSSQRDYWNPAHWT